MHVLMMFGFRHEWNAVLKVCSIVDIASGVVCPMKCEIHWDLEPSRAGWEVGRLGGMLAQGGGWTLDVVQLAHLLHPSLHCMVTIKALQHPWLWAC